MVSNIKDNNDTRTLINKLNTDNTRYDYHGFHNYYYNNDRHRGGGGGGGD